METATVNYVFERSLNFVGEPAMRAMRSILDQPVDLTLVTVGQDGLFFVPGHPKVLEDIKSLPSAQPYLPLLTQVEGMEGVEQTHLHSGDKRAMIEAIDAKLDEQSY